MPPRISRVAIIVFDSLGVGALPDAYLYGDEGSNTLANMAAAVSGLDLPCLEKLGLGNIIEVEGLEGVREPMACFGRMAEVSPGKDTLTGHWELSGLILDQPFPVYPDGFPASVIEAFETAIGRKTLGNKPASGTEIVKELGEEHLSTGFPIVYTSADSVFQIAAHEEIIPVSELYGFCEIARDILVGEHNVARVIARPFIGDSPMSFKRTHRRRDFSCEPPGITLLDIATGAGLTVWGVGKIPDIFAERGITEGLHSKSNEHSLEQTLELITEPGEGIVFTNLVDFDTLWGHRNDAMGYARGLREADSKLGEIVEAIRTGDMLVITADHGCDPTTAGTDHSREYVPLLVYSPQFARGRNLGTRKSFADLGKTVADVLGLENSLAGESFLSALSS